MAANAIIHYTLPTKHHAMTPIQTEARKEIETLIKLYNKLSANERKTMTEAGVVHQFIDPLLAALG